MNITDSPPIVTPITCAESLIPQKPPRPLISIVVPAFNECQNIPILYDKLNMILPESFPVDWELIFVDDGSRDKTWMGINALLQKDTRVRGIRLSRNFGHQYALMAGLESSLGDAVITMDCDLQHPMALLPEMIKTWQQGCSIVKMVRQDAPQTRFLKKFTSRLYYSIFTWLSDIPMQSGLSDFRLIDRRIVEELKRFHEEGLFLRGLVEWIGFDTCELPYQAADRLSGLSQYSVKKMFKLAWHGVSSFSTLPLRIGILIGIIGTILSIFGILYALYAKFIQGEAVPGWTSIVMGVSLLFSLLFVYLGIIGEYIGRIVIEVRNRPRFIVMDRIGFSERIQTHTESDASNLSRTFRQKDHAESTTRFSKGSHHE
ncbi:MAG: glycosyltransferase family 2 protein [Desulfatirhabdiaceae bacterium]